MKNLVIFYLFGLLFLSTCQTEERNDVSINIYKLYAKSSKNDLAFEKNYGPYLNDILLPIESASNGRENSVYFPFVKLVYFINGERKEDSTLYVKYSTLNEIRNNLIKLTSRDLKDEFSRFRSSLRSPVAKVFSDIKNDPLDPNILQQRLEQALVNPVYINIHDGDKGIKQRLDSLIKASSTIDIIFYSYEKITVPIDSPSKPKGTTRVIKDTVRLEQINIFCLNGETDKIHWTGTDRKSYSIEISCLDNECPVLEYTTSNMYFNVAQISDIIPNNRYKISVRYARSKSPAAQKNFQLIYSGMNKIIDPECCKAKTN